MPRFPTLDQSKSALLRALRANSLRRSGSRARPTSARSYTAAMARAAQSGAGDAANDRHLGNFFDEIRIEVATLLRRPGEILAIGQVRIGVRLDDVDGVVVGETDVDA